MEPATYGQILPPDAWLLRKEVGSGEMDGMQYQMQLTARSTPVIESKATGKRFVLDWEDIVRLAQAAGIDEQDEGGV